MMITSSKCRPRNNAERYWLTVSPYQIRRPRFATDPTDQLNCTAVATKHPRVEIEYCTQCRWLLRAAWMAQELLTTFEADIGEVALMPGGGGIFEVRVNGTRLWSRRLQR